MSDNCILCCFLSVILIAFYFFLIPIFVFPINYYAPLLANILLIIFAIFIGIYAFSKEEKKPDE